MVFHGVVRTKEVRNMFASQGSSPSQVSRHCCQSLWRVFFNYVKSSRKSSNVGLESTPLLFRAERVDSTHIGMQGLSCGKSLLLRSYSIQPSELLVPPR